VEKAYYVHCEANEMRVFVNAFHGDEGNVNGMLPSWWAVCVSQIVPFSQIFFFF
jgi:hypothetical protein